MKKLILFIFAATLFVACDNGSSTTSSDVESVVLSPASFELTVGGTKTLNLITTPSTVVDFEEAWTSSDESVATVSSTGLVTAVALGSATITVCVDGNDNLKATSTVEVKDAYDVLVFDRAVLWNYENTFDITDYGYTGSTGATLDSAYECYFMVLSSDLFLDSDYAVAGTDNYFLRMQTAFAFDDDYVYTLGSYYFVDYEAVDDNGNPEPYAVQACEFDEDAYIDLYTEWFNGNSASSSDYPYLRDNDSEMYFGVNDDDDFYWMSSGFLATGGESIEFSSADSPYYVVEYYNFNATFFGEPYSYGFSTYEEDGSYYFEDPLTMAEMTTVNLANGTSVYSAPAQNAPKQLTGKIDRTTFMLQTQVSRLTMMPLMNKLQDANFKIK